MRAAGSTPSGQTALQAHADRHADPVIESTRSRMRSTSWWRGSSSTRWAAASTAGPRYSGAPDATGHAETQARHSNSPRSVRRLPRRHPARCWLRRQRNGSRPPPCGRTGTDGHPVDLLLRIDRQVGDRCNTAQRLDREHGPPVPDVGEWCDARQSLAPVDANRAGPARSVMAGVAEDERWIRFGPGPLDHVEDRVGRPLHGYLDLLVPGSDRPGPSATAAVEVGQAS